MVLGIATVGQAQTYPSQLMNHETEINAIIKEITLEARTCSRQPASPDWVLPT